MDFEKYKKQGFAGEVVGSIVMLIVGLGVATLVLIFTSVLGGQTYQLVEGKIDAISNETVKANIKSAAIAGFEAQKQTGEYLPLIALAVVIFMVLGLVLSMTNFSGMGGGFRGSAL